jgi:hypothetical protein
MFKMLSRSQVQWLIPVILATLETETERITITGQPEQKVRETLISKKKKN